MDSFFNCSLNIHSILYNSRLIGRDILNKEIDRFAAYLSKAQTSGFNKNYYLKFENNIGSIVAYFGILKTGGNAIILNPQIKSLEFQEYHNICHGEKIISPPEYPFQQNWDNYITHLSNPEDSYDPIPQNQWTIAFTNGMDGNMGAALLSPNNLVENATAYSMSNQMDDTHTSYSLLPFYHLYGLQVGLITPSLTGGKIILSPSQDLLNLKQVSKHAAENNRIILYSIPAFYHLLLEQHINFPFSNFKNFISGGYALTENIATNFCSLTGKYIQQGYGLTEAGPIVSWNINPNERNYLSVGQIIGDTICKIINPDKTTKAGEIVLKGNNIFTGYWKNDQKTSTKLVNKWLHTQDSGYIKEGDLYITSQPKKVLNKLGHNLYVEEIKRYIESHPQVLKAKIYPVSKNAGGDILAAEITLKREKALDKISLKKWLMDRISNYKIPQRLIIH